MQVVFVLVGFGLYPAIQRQYALSGDGRDPGKLLSFSIMASIVLTAVIYVAGPVWSDYMGFDSYSRPVRLAVLWAGTSAITNSALALLRSQDRLVAFGAVTMLQSVVAEVTSLALVVFVDATATMFLLGQLVVQTVAAGVALTFVPPRGLRLRDRLLVQRALVFGLPLVPAVLCTFVLDSADRLMIQSELGPAAVARYQVAYNVGALPMLLLGVLNASWMPRIFAFNSVDERAAVIAASRDLLYRLLIPTLLGLAVGAPIVLRIWAPASYHPGMLLVVNAIVLVAAIPYTAGLASTRSLMAEGRTAYLAVAQGLAAVVNVGLNLLLIPLYGLEGSAAATLLALVLLHQLLACRARAVVPVRPPRWRLVAALVVTAGGTLLISLVPADRFLGVRLLAVGLTVLWFASLFINRTGVERKTPSPRSGSDREAFDD
jgi:O-antigen/teichoic acid export membrane protein